MDYNVTTGIPIHFEKIEEYNDERFTKVLIYIAHTGLNRNNSVFSKKLLKKMIPSLARIPIVGYISVDNYNEIDFNGHEEKITIVDDDVEITYLGRAYGFIGEDHNARFEYKEVDGEKVEFLVCEGYIWNKFSECKEIFDRDSVKSQSMELLPSSIKGKFEKDGHFHFTDAVFEAACILGENVSPAMKGSTIEKFSTQFKEFIFKEVESYKNNNYDEGGKDKLDKFTWSASQLRDELSRIVSESKETDKWGYEYCKHYYIDHLSDENIVIVFDSEKRYYVGYPYTIDGDKVSIDMSQQTRYKSTWTQMEQDTDEDKSAVVPIEFSEYVVKTKEAEVNATFAQTISELEAKNNELTEKVTSFETKFAEIEREKHEKAVAELFSTFSKELTEEEMKNVKENRNNMSLDEINTQLFALVGKKKAKFSTKSVEDDKFAKFTFVESNKGNEPEWADLVVKKH